MTNTHALCSYNDNQVTLVYFTKPTLKKGIVKKWSTLDSKLQVVELAGPSGRRLERKMSINTNGDMVSTYVVFLQFLNLVEYLYVLRKGLELQLSHSGHMKLKF